MKKILILIFFGTVVISCTKKNISITALPKINLIEESSVYNINTAYLEELEDAKKLDKELGYDNLASNEEIDLKETFNADYFVYSVKSGDDFAKIAKRFNVSKFDLSETNNDKKLKTGDLIKVPIGVSNVKFNSPIENINLVRVSSPFGYRNHPIKKDRRPHKGIDLAIGRGTKVYVIGDGIVEKSYKSSSYGNVIRVNHSDGYSSVYAHLKKRNVKIGDKVKAGDLIALSGNTGWSTGPHLHFEIRKDETPLNPVAFIDGLNENIVAYIKENNFALK